MMNKLIRPIFGSREIFHTGLRTVLIVLLGTTLLMLTSCSGKMEKNIADNSRLNMSMEERWGVKVESLRYSAAGNLIDFRYRIKDADKALHLVDRKNKPYLVDESTGKVLSVPNTAKVGPLRQTVRYGKPKEDRVYFVLFGNPGGFIKPGSQVTIVIGDFRAERLVVEE